MITVPALVALVVALMPGAAAQEDAGADLVLVKEDNEDPVFAGGIASFSVNITNKGPATATGGRLVDTHPASFEFTGGAPSCRAVDATTVVCDVEPLPPGASVGLALNFRPTEQGDYTNTAVVSADQTDPNPEDNRDSEQMTVINPKGIAPPPESLSCEAVSDGVRLSWPSVTFLSPDGEETQVTEYQIQRRGPDDDGFTIYARVEGTTFLDENVDPEKTYTYRVQSLQPPGAGQPSEPCTVTAIPVFPTPLVAAFAVAGAVGVYGAFRYRARR